MVLKRQGFQDKDHVRSSASFVHRKVKAVAFKALLKKIEDILDKVRHLDKSATLIPCLL